MGNHVLFILLCKSSLIILVHGCTYNFDCSKSDYLGCCVYKKCKYILYDDSCSNYYGVYCVDDVQCTDGCCIDSSCTSETDSLCIAKKNTCYGDWECESNCCKNDQCQKNDSLCTSKF